MHTGIYSNLLISDSFILQVTTFVMNLGQLLCLSPVAASSYYNASIY